MKILKTAKYIAAEFGKFKYKCDECGEFTHLSRQQRSSRNIPRCNYCGSTYLDPVTDFANTEMQNSREEFEERKTDMRYKMNY